MDDTFIASGSSETKEIAKLHAAEAALSKLTKSKTSDASLQTKVDFNESTEIKDAKKILHELCDKKKLPKPTYKYDFTTKYWLLLTTTLQAILSDTISFILELSKNWVPTMIKDSYRPLKLSFLIKFYVWKEIWDLD